MDVIKSGYVYFRVGAVSEIFLLFRGGDVMCQKRKFTCLENQFIFFAAASDNNLASIGEGLGELYDRRLGFIDIF